MSAAVTVALLVLAACSSKDDDGASAEGEASPETTAVDAAALFGEPNPATGDPITVGVISDGETDAIDNTQGAEAVVATLEYANEYLGGINGHPVETVTCETGQTPAGATSCAVEMIDAGVAAVLVGISGQDEAIYNGLAGSGIPYVSSATAAPDILLGEDAFVFANPLGGFAAGVLLAEEEEVDHAAFVVIDVPAATGAVSAIAAPLFEDAGITLDLVNIAPTVADMSPQIQQALSRGAAQFSLIGTEQFVGSALRALDQAAFDGTTISVSPGLSPEVVDTIPGGVEGVLVFPSATSDPADEDFQRFLAILEEYAPDTPDDGVTRAGHITALAFVRALTGVDEAVDATSISAALAAMPEPVPMPMGAGITFQCGHPPAPTVPNACVTDILRATLDAAGEPTDYEPMDVSSVLQG